MEQKTMSGPAGEFTIMIGKPGANGRFPVEVVRKPLSHEIGDWVHVCDVGLVSSLEEAKGIFIEVANYGRVRTADERHWGALVQGVSAALRLPWEE